MFSSVSGDWGDSLGSDWKWDQGEESSPWDDQFLRGRPRPGFTGAIGAVASEDAGTTG
ncbi:hypothetical protein NW765_010897 [Fusarium oxysporum]|nr:hypothetical protein NW765_010897 [Fusarium oxysporum]